uniref:RNA 2'-phosphotransferase n=1 Tax=Thermus aquaticus TaxID=271 RepID=UPI001E555E84|nr:RNA 2'-phosphotransferase [Thermus aquaticus]
MEVVKVVALVPNTDGTVIGKLSDKALEGIVKRHGAIVHPRLIAEGWVDLEELEGLGAVEVLEVNPLPGEAVFVPTRSGWVLLRVE